MAGRGTVSAMSHGTATQPTTETETAPNGAVLLRRGTASDTVVYVESGRVVVGVMGTGAGRASIEHQLGVMDGPCWLEATAAVLNLPSALDAIAQTDVQLHRVPLEVFRDRINTCPSDAQTLILDIARAHREQTELTVSRLAKDAEARCAEWLLNHAQGSDAGGCAVHLQQRKRAIAAQLGIAPETLSRVLRHLRDLRLISGSGRVVDLIDLVGLRSLAGAGGPCACGIV